MPAQSTGPDESATQNLKGYMIRDPHVFPYVVKGWRESTGDLRLESRRSKEEAKQSADRFKVEGFQTWIFCMVEQG